MFLRIRFISYIIGMPVHGYVFGASKLPGKSKLVIIAFLIPVDIRTRQSKVTLAVEASRIAQRKERPPYLASESDAVWFSNSCSDA
mmetsp:Transcript_5888/g.11634  ORF Transcript_5888/g.11634 Transcript_5888/m.11634 type:complete len:86 (-) Transcript_5888:82-339(-)